MTQPPHPDVPPGTASPGSPVPPADAPPPAAPEQAAPEQTAPAYPAPPYSAPPAYAGPAPAAYGAPVSGPGYPPPPTSAVPVSAYPTTGYPGLPIPPPRVPTRKGPWLWVLVGVCVVVTAGIGALGYLLVTENRSSQLAIAEQDAKIEDLQSRIRQRESENEGLRDANDGSKTILDAEEARLADLQQCPAAVQAYVDAAVARDEAAFEQAINRMIDVCHL